MTKLAWSVTENAGFAVPYSMSKHVKIGLVQMSCLADVAANVAKAEANIREAAHDVHP